MWTTTLSELRALMEHRAQLLIWQPLTKHEHLETVTLPYHIDDEYGAPPVVVWLGPKLKEKAGGKPSEPDCGDAVCASGGTLAGMRAGPNTGSGDLVLPGTRTTNQ